MKALLSTRLWAIGIILCLGAAGWSAQTETKPPAFGIAFSGFLKTDLIYDSRQTTSVREGHFLLYPKGELPDPDGRDRNAAPSFHLLSIQSRLLGRITGPDAFGAKTSGLLETEFFGTSDADINGFRLRHAYVKLAWGKGELMIGQFWHPMFVTESFPEVVSFNTGVPFQPFNRSPQVRFTRFLGAWSASVTALSQRDFASTGPEGGSTAYARNAALPEFNLKIQYLKAGDGGREFLAGAGADYKRLVPRLATTEGYAADEGLGDWAGMAFLKWKIPSLTFKAEAVYGQNLHHLTMMGGYGVREVTDAVRGRVSYVSTESVAVWGEIMTNGTAFQTGLFFGYTKNLGAGVDLAVPPAYARGADIDTVWRIAPRALYNSGKVRIAGEIEYTAAAYGAPDGRGGVAGAREVGNLRLLGAVYYFF